MTHNPTREIARKLESMETPSLNRHLAMLAGIAEILSPRGRLEFALAGEIAARRAAAVAHLIRR